MSWSPPKFYFAQPTHGTSYFFPTHPDFKRQDNTFIEPSSYRDFRRKELGRWELDDGYKYGVVLDGISEFLPACKHSEEMPLPDPGTVVSRGYPFHEFLVRVASCSLGKNIDSYVEFNRRIRQVARGVRLGEDDEVQFNPNFGLLVRYGLELPEIPYAFSEIGEFRRPFLDDETDDDS